jgi:hypothetical protein
MRPASRSRELQEVLWISGYPFGPSVCFPGCTHEELLKRSVRILICTFRSVNLHKERPPYLGLTGLM